MAEQIIDINMHDCIMLHDDSPSMVCMAHWWYKTYFLTWLHFARWGIYIYECKDITDSPIFCSNQEPERIIFMCAYSLVVSGNWFTRTCCCFANVTGNDGLNTKHWEGHRAEVFFELERLRKLHYLICQQRHRFSWSSSSLHLLRKK